MSVCFAPTPMRIGVGLVLVFGASALAAEPDPERRLADALTPVLGIFEACLATSPLSERQPPTSITLTGEVSADGTVTTLALTPVELERSPLGECLFREVRRLSFPMQNRASTFAIPLRTPPRVFLATSQMAPIPHRRHPFKRSFAVTAAGVSLSVPVGETGTTIVALRLPSPLPPAARRAQDLLERGDFDSALRALEPCLAAERAEACQVLEVVALRFREGRGDLVKALAAHGRLGAECVSKPTLDRLVQIELR